MRSPAKIAGALLLILAAGLAGAGEGDEDVIRLAPRAGQSGDGTAAHAEEAESRRGFDYAAFEARLESLWFQRKTLLANGRDADSREQLEQIRAFCAEEGIKRLDHLAGALVAEAHRFHREGNDAHALSALDFAAMFDPHRPQIHMARATVLWHSGAGSMSALREILRAVQASMMHSLRDLSLLPRIVFVLGLAGLGAALSFALLMLLRHQASFRHSVEELAGDSIVAPWNEVAGWVALWLPLLTWVGAGWSALYWLVICFRFMSQRERMATVTILLITLVPD